MKVSEQIKVFDMKRREHEQTIRNLMKLAAEGMRSLDPTEASAYDLAVSEIAMIDAHIPRLERHGVDV